jgi:hypothetical protein
VLVDDVGAVAGFAAATIRTIRKASKKILNPANTETMPLEPRKTQTTRKESGKQSRKRESRKRKWRFSCFAVQKNSSGFSSFNQHWPKADKVGLTCWSANPAAQQRRPATSM